MKTLKIVRIKPNPRGKDKAPWGRPLAGQLVAEWVDFQNIGAYEVDLQGVTLLHRAYSTLSSYSMEVVVTFKGVVGAGEVVRVHSGTEEPLATEDSSGAKYHIFTGHSKFVWNNKQGDEPTLSDPQGIIDRATYDPNPPEGCILSRVGNKLLYNVAGLFNF